MADAKSTRKCPYYLLHKPSGQAVVTIHAKDHYLGPHGSPESRLRYERLITAWMQAPDAPIQIEPDLAGDLTVVELCAQHLTWANGYYTKNGSPTSEIPNIKRAIKTLRETFASLPAKEFSPLKLKQVRQRFVDDGLARTVANKYTPIVVRIFSWGVENELIPSSVVHALREVKSLPRGRCEARETDPILPVDDDTIERTCEHLPPIGVAMVKIQLLLACRPGELVSMRPCDIDMSKPIWIYRPQSHKSEHRGKARIIPIGPRARLLLAPLLPEFAAMPVWRVDGKPLTPAAYGWMIAAACKRAGIPHWTPNRLRHAGATKIRAEASLDAAQVILGHATIATTQIYAEKNVDAAMQIAAKIG